MQNSSAGKRASAFPALLNRNCISNRLAMLLASTLAVFLLISIPAVAQERFGEINGTATDPSGGVLPNATVTLTEVNTNRVQTTNSTSDGAFVFRSLDPGTYKIRVQAPGFS